MPVDALVALAFGLAGGLAALAAIVAAPSGAVDVDTGALIGLKGLVAALVVRFGSPLHAMAAGLALGVVEAAIANVHLGDLELGPAYSEVAPARARARARRAAAPARGRGGARVSAAAAARTRRALTRGARRGADAWSPWYTAAAVLVALAALVPTVAPSWVHIDSLADGLYLALAATGLWIAVGLAGMPSLGQGAFMAIGAFAVALLTAKAGWPALPATLVGVAAAAAGGVVDRRRRRAAAAGVRRGDDVDPHLDGRALPASRSLRVLGRRAGHRRPARRFR